MNYSIIVTFFNEEKNIYQLNDELKNVIEKLSTNNSLKFELIYIDDGSTDKTFNELLKCKNNKFKTKIIRHRYNLSQSSALFTGIHYSKFENLIFLDGDLQNDPHDIENMVNIFEKGCDMVVGWRKNRIDSFFSKTLPSKIANFFVRFFTKSKIHDQGCSLKVLKKELIDYHVTWGDFHRLLSARLSNSNLKIEEVVVNHRPRSQGKSNYNFSRIFRVLLDLIFMNFLKIGSRPIIYFFGNFGLLSFFGSLISLIFMIYLKIFNFVDFDQTPLPILTVFLFLMGLLFLFIGLLAQLIINQSSRQDYIEKSIKEIIEN
jgi:glycosyltransferase involved in cell wall biosynthesis